MDEFLKRLVPVVSADTLAQPTFGTLNVTPIDTVTGTRVDLESETTSVKVGDNITIKVFIQTGPSIGISQYRLVVEYDQNILSVIDQDTATLGTQIKNTNPNFIVANISTDNLTSNGRSRLVASISGGIDTELSSKTEVAEITFNAQSIANTVVKIATGSTGTQLKTSAGRLIGYTSSEKQISVVNEIITPSPTETPTITPTATIFPTPVITSTPTITSGVYVSTIPATAITLDSVFLFPFILGTVLVVLGLSIIPKSFRK